MKEDLENLTKKRLLLESQKRIIEKNPLAARIFLNPYIPVIPTNKQLEFALNMLRDFFYGGSAGPGKSTALLIAALMYVDVPSYAAILIRRTYADLVKPNGLMDQLENFLGHTDAVWIDKQKAWKFPSGATASLGYLDGPRDIEQYDGTEYQFVGIDEITQVREKHFLYMFSRQRKLDTVDVPLRMRAASNPMHAGYEWVKRRYIDTGNYLPATLEDNPYIEKESYIEGLNYLDPITRKKLLEGDWSVREEGNYFKREWMEVVESAPPGNTVRYWDLAATEAKKGKDPDWTVGCKVTYKDGVYFVEHIVRKRATPQQIESLIYQTAFSDGKNCKIFMEQEPGASGKSLIDHYARSVLQGFYFVGIKPTGDKVTRAMPFSSAAEKGNVKLVNGIWINSFLDELEMFPSGDHDDQVDAFSGACDNAKIQYKPHFAAIG